MFLVIVVCVCYFFFFKQKTAYEMRISDWSSDVCSSDLLAAASGFSWRLMAASLACLVHALLPFLFVKTGSRAITELHERMVTNRQRQAERTAARPAARRAA